MENDFQFYLLKSAGAVALFYLFYWIVLRKDTHFNLNRLYLIGAILISACMPFFSFSPLFLPEVSPKIIRISSEYLGTNSTPLEKVEQESEVGWENLINYVFLAGMGLMALRFLHALTRLWLLYRSSGKARYAGKSIYYSPKITAPFSFFSLIFYPQKDNFKEDKNHIITHELVHVNQLHSLDILLAELFLLVQWFNPFAWLVAKAVRENHEFLADCGATKQGEDKYRYQMTLIKAVCLDKEPLLSHSFNSLTKRRIEMMNASASSPISRWKVLAALPLIAGLMVAFTQPREQEIIFLREEGQSKIWGRVLNAETKLPLDGAFVGFKGTTRGTMTRVDGTYEIASGGEAKILIFHYNGMERVEVEIGNATSIDVELHKNKSKTYRYLDGVEIERLENSLEEHIEQNKNRIDPKYHFRHRFSYPQFVEDSTRREFTRENKYKYDDLNPETLSGKGNFLPRKHLLPQIKIDGAYLYVLDGKVMKHNPLKKKNKIEVENYVILSAEEARKKYGKDKVIEISTKKKQSSKSSLYLQKEKSQNTDIKVLRPQPLANGVKVRAIVTGDQKPIYEIDGKLEEESKMTQLNPSDIISIEVLKGEESIRRFGSKATAGAIVIKTRPKHDPLKETSDQAPVD